MAKPSKSAIAEALLETHGQTHSVEIGFDPSKNQPSPLFRLLCASLLFSARISAELAVSAARALADQGWTTAQKMADASWDERARTLNEAGYARFDERTATMLGETAEHLVDRYRGDLRKLRETAERDVTAERRLLKEFKGLGDVGVDIFFREVQGAWKELYPFADKRAAANAEKLGLDGDADALAGLVDEADFPRLVAALVRVGDARTRDRVLKAAA